MSKKTKEKRKAAQKKQEAHHINLSDAEIELKLNKLLIEIGQLPS